LSQTDVNWVGLGGSVESPAYLAPAPPETPLVIPEIPIAELLQEFRTIPEEIGITYYVVLPLFYYKSIIIGHSYNDTFSYFEE
jgi:hypothetical protein